MKHSMMRAAIVGALVWSAAGPFRLAAQEPSTAAATSAKAPRMADGHPDLSGVWWRGADIGGRSATPAGGPGAPGGGRPAQPPPSFSSSIPTFGRSPTPRPWAIRTIRRCIALQRRSAL